MTAEDGLVARRSPARFEAVERAALASLHEAAPAEVRERLGMRLETIGGATLSIVSGIDSIVLNRAVGLGVESPGSEAAVDAIAAAYAGAGVRRHLVHLSDEARPEEVGAWLDRAGYREYRGWVPFARDAGARGAGAGSADVDSDLEVRLAGPELAEPFGEIAARAFDLGDAGVPLVAALTRHPKWRTYLTLDGGEPAGAAGLFLHEGAGWCDWAATRPEFRSRGSQRALLARRVAEADEAGCEVVFTETGEAVPGDPQHSFHNIQRAGFEAGPVRANRILEA